MTYSWSATGGQLSGSGTTATLTAANADAGKTITVTGTATTTRTGGNPDTQSSSCTAQVTVPPIISCVSIEDWGECTFEKNPKKPWRVDNDCKDVLDKTGSPSAAECRMASCKSSATRTRRKTVDVKDIGAPALGQREVLPGRRMSSVRRSDGIAHPASRGGTKGKATHFYFVPDGNLCSGQVVEGTPVDENAVQGQSRTAKAPAKKKAKKAAAPPAQ